MVVVDAIWQLHTLIVMNSCVQVCVFATLTCILGECRALWGSPDKLTYCVPILRSDRRLGGPGGAAQLIREAGGGACDVATFT